MNRTREHRPAADTAVAQPADPVEQAALELVARYGDGARNLAQERVERLERAASWQEHTTALRVLTAVERLLDRQAE